MAYYMKQVAATMWRITQGGRTLGTIMPSKEHPGNYVVTVDGDRTWGRSPDHVFEQVVARLNRIALCGVNDEALARAALERRNDRVRAQQAELASLGIRTRIKKGTVRI